MNHETRLSFQKVFNSSIVLAAPRIRANKTSTPPSARPQKELQKSSVRFCSTGEESRAYLDNEVVEDVLLAAISEFGEISVEKQDWIWRPYFIRPNVQNAHVWSKPYQEGQSAFQVLGTQLLNRDRRSDVRLFVFFQWQWSVLDLALPHCLGSFYVQFLCCMTKCLRPRYPVQSACSLHRIWPKIWSSAWARIKIIRLRLATYC